MPWLKEVLGHDGPPGDGENMALWDRNMLTDEPILLCPIRALQIAPQELQAEVIRMRMELFPLFEKGLLLVKGGVADQPARYVEYMRTIEDLNGQVKAKLNQSAEEHARDAMRSRHDAVVGPGGGAREQEE